MKKRVLTFCVLSFLTITFAFAQLSKPSLNLPANDATPASVYFKLEWQKVTNATSYICEVDTTMGFNSPALIIDTLLPGQFSTRTQSSYTYCYKNYDHYYGKTHYWRVRAFNDNDISPWSLLRHYTPSSACGLNTPANGATNVTLSTKLLWNQITGTTTYRLQIDTTPAFSSPMLTDTLLTVDTLRRNFLFNTTYYWRVQCYSLKDTSAWSAVGNFTTISDNVTLSSPANNVVDQTVKITASCNSISGISKYDFQLDTVPTFDSPMVTITHQTTNTVTFTPLRYGQQYYWRVRAVAERDTGAWSNYRTFTTRAQVVLSSPSDGYNIGNVLSTTLSWTAITGTTKYWYQCDTTLAFNSPKLKDGTTTGTSLTANKLLYGATYYWRVCAIDAIDTSDWQTPRSFTNKPYPTLNNPADNTSLTNTASSTFSWTSYSNTSFQWQIDTVPTFDSPRMELLNKSTNTSFTYSTLPFDRTVYWRVRCISDYADTSAWTPARKLHTSSSSLNTPADGFVLSNTLKRSVSWTQHTASSYQYMWDTTPNFNSQYKTTGTITTSSTVSTTLTFCRYGETCYWTMRNYHAKDTSDWKTPRSITTPATLALSSPADGDTLTTMYATLQCTAITGTSKYEYQCDTVPTFDSPYRFDKFSTTNSYKLEPLLIGKKHFWRMRAISTCDTSAWSIVRSFVTANNFSLVSPTDSTVYTSSFAPTLKWTQLLGCLNYIYQIDTTSNFDSKYLVEGTVSSSYNTVVTPTLRYERVYYWRVRAVNAIDTTAWSVAWRFYTPKGPKCSSPADNANVTSMRPAISWTSAYNATKYEYQCDTSSDFSSNYLVKGSTTSTSVSCTYLRYDKKYYWHVRAIKSTDTSDWSPARCFFTPVGPIPSSPADNAYLSCSSSATLMAQTITNNTSYIFQYDTVATFDSPADTIMASTSASITLPALDFATQYYWRICGATNRDTSQWSVIRTFTTPQYITLTSPYDNTISTTLCARTFMWSSCSGFISNYEFEIDTVTTFDSPMADELRTWTTSTSYTFGSVHEFKNYYWRVRGINLDGTDTTAWTSYYTYTVQDTMLLSTPANNSFIGHVSNQQLTWIAKGCVTKYEYQCDTTSTFDSPWLKRGTTANSNTTVVVPYYGTRYYWRARAIAPDTSVWSSVYDFVTIDSTNLSTSNNLTLTSPCNTFSCKAITGTTKYRFQFDTMATFNSSYLLDTVCTSTSVYVLLHYGSQYYWRVQMINASDTSHWSLLRTFTTPDTIALQSPNDNGNLSTMHPVLKCTNVMSCYDNNIWRLDTSVNFNSPLYQNGSGNNVTMNYLHYGTTYYWQMAAVNSAPDTSSWSSYRRFTTPNTLTLSSPAHGTILTTPCTTFSWGTITGSTGYEYQADTALTFDSPLLIYRTWTSSTTSFSNTQMHYGKTYHWRVRAFNEVDSSDWSAVRDITTPDTIKMTSPAEGTVLTTLSTTLCWNNMGCSNNYHLQVDTTAAFNSDIMVDDVTNSCYSTNKLLYGKTYYWHVRPFTSYDTAYWQTQPWTFTTAANVTLTAPLDSSILTDLSTVLRWEGIGGSTHYIYEYDTVPTFNSPALQTGIRPDGYLYMSLYDLPFNTTYYWRVRAYNDIDTSSWTPTWQFSTPIGVTLNSPADNAVNTCNSIQWSRLISVPYYDYKIDTTMAFNSSELRTGTLVDANSVSFTNPTLRYGTTYYWTVKAYSPEDTSVWVTPYSFTTVAAPTLSSPANGNTVSAGSCSLSWSSVCLATTKYEYCVATDSNFAYIVVQNTTTSTSFSRTYDYGMTYYWKVRAINEVDTSDWSTPWTFKTNCHTGSMSLSTPVHNANNIPVCGQNFQWSGYAYPSYEFEYSLNASFEPCNSMVVYGTSMVLLDTLMGNTTYYWRVRGVLNSGYGCWSSVYTFVTMVNYVAGVTNVINTCGSSYTWHGHTYFVNGTYRDTIHGLNADTIHTLNLTLHQPFTIETSQNACDFYTWEGQTYTASGTYSKIYQSIYGCDSTMVLHLTIYNTPDAVIQYDSVTHTLTCLSTGVTYQWLDCDNNYTPILGATSSTYTPEASGRFAVLVKAGGICADVSDCIEVDLTSGVSAMGMHEITCYPNPVTASLQLSGLLGDETITIYDVVGKEILKVLAKQSVKELDFAPFENGTYFIEVKNADYKVVKKIVKE